MRRILLSALAALTLAGTLGGCYAHEPEYREHVYYDRDGRAYRHARWHDEDVYRHEDGRWYVRRGDRWEMREAVIIP